MFSKDRQWTVFFEAALTALITREGGGDLTGLLRRASAIADGLAAASTLSVEACDVVYDD